MEINKKSKKELKELLRKKVCNNQQPRRHTLLAYAFVRDVPYIILERKTNEDKFGELGRNSFLYGLASDISAELWYIAYNKKYYDLFIDLYKKKNEISTIRKILFNIVSTKNEELKALKLLKEETDTLVLNWLKDKYKEASLEAA